MKLDGIGVERYTSIVTLALHWIFSLTGRRDVKLKLSTDDVRIHFSDALEHVASTERLFLLTSFANMATTRKESDREFIESVCLELIEIGFLTPALFESCCKGRSSHILREIRLKESPFPDSDRRNYFFTFDLLFFTQVTSTFSLSSVYIFSPWSMLTLFFPPIDFGLLLDRIRIASNRVAKKVI